MQDNGDTEGSDPLTISVYVSSELEDRTSDASGSIYKTKCLSDSSVIF